jgi:hypothetical protein
MTGKHLSDNQLLGERGVALIANRVAEMGFAWRPTSVLDSGIDGEIELRDSATGEMSGCRRRLNFDPPCRLNFDPGMDVGIVDADCG